MTFTCISCDNKEKIFKQQLKNIEAAIKKGQLQRLQHEFKKLDKLIASKKLFNIDSPIKGEFLNQAVQLIDCSEDVATRLDKVTQYTDEQKKWSTSLENINSPLIRQSIPNLSKATSSIEKRLEGIKTNLENSKSSFDETRSLCLKKYEEWLKL